MKWKPTASLLVALAVPALASAPSAASPGATVLELKFRTLRDFDITLPAEQFVPILDGLPFALAPGGQLKCAITDTGLAFDRDGDGTTDAEVAATDEDHPTRLLTFRLADGTEYAVRAKLDGRWQAAPGGAMMGALGKQPVAFIDQNGNGRFNDIGEDAMVIGRSKVASFLSEVIEVDGELFNLSLSPDGQKAELEPFAGATGQLDLASDFESKAKLRALVLNSTDGRYSFELGANVTAGTKALVPAGEYTIHSGEIVLGKSSAKVHQGRSQTLVVSPGGETAMTWGGPVTAEVAYDRQYDEIVIAPNDVTYFGRAGEAYTDFMPLGSSPAFKVKDRVTGDVLVDMVFPGNC